MFIGVVTYSATSFPEAQSFKGAGARLVQACKEQGLEATLSIEDRNLWTELGGKLTMPVRSSYREELAEEWRWRGFLGTRSTWWAARHATRWVRTIRGQQADQEQAIQQRLLNIEWAHRSLWEQALDSGSEISLILEDDATVENATDVAEGLVNLATSPWSYVNLSLSFGPDQLGIARLLQPSGLSWGGTVSREVLRSSRPVTNTVCAIGYRREFLTRFVNHWISMPVEPVLPIDWKMNRALRELVNSGILRPGSSLWVEPGPLVQGSLHRHTRS